VDGNVLSYGLNAANPLKIVFQKTQLYHLQNEVTFATYNIINKKKGDLQMSGLLVSAQLTTKIIESLHNDENFLIL